MLEIIQVTIETGLKMYLFSSKIVRMFRYGNFTYLVTTENNGNNMLVVTETPEQIIEMLYPKTDYSGFGLTKI